jgi:hypothetical protein
MGRIIDLNLRQSIGPARALLALNLILVLALNDVYDYFPLEYYEVGKKQAILGLQKFNLFYVFGASGFLLRLLSPVFSSPFLLYVLTISIMLIEFLLFLGLFSRNRSFNNKLFVLGLGFHLGIWFLVGLGPFSMVMVAGLYLFLIFKHDSIISNFFQHEAHLSTTK